MMDTLLQDLRYGLRALRRNRAFTLAAVLCLGLGIGVNTTVFTVVYATLLRPLPIADGDRLVTIWGTQAAANEDQSGLTYGDLADFKASGAFSALGAYSGRNFALTDGEFSERVEGSAITPNVFDLIGVRPQLGRTFAESEAAASGFEQVVIIGDDLWRTRFGADPAILGRTIRINDRAITVVGVMPPGFAFPGNDKLWMPLGPPELAGARFLWALGRLAPGVGVEEAQRRLDPISAQLAQRDEAHREWTATVVSYRASIVDADGQTMIWVSFGAVLFVLMIACANVANLLLARSADRQREIAVRMALGASRARVLRQLLTESVLLSLMGGVLGVVIAIWWTETTVRSIPEEMAYWIRFDLDWGVLLFTLAIAVGTGVIFGLVPALQTTKDALHAELKEGTRASGDSGGRTRLRSSLVVAEVALSLVLLVGAALMMQSFLRMQSADAGFDTRPLLSLRITMPGDRYDDLEARGRTIGDVTTRLRALPGVAAAAAMSAIPIDDGGDVQHVRAAGTAGAGATMADAPRATVIAVSTGAFDAMGIRLEAGRDFRAEEVQDSTRRVIVVGHTLAATLFPDGGALGAGLMLGDSGVAYSIIGIAPDVQYEEFMEETAEDALQVYTPYARMRSRQMALLVRTPDDPDGAAFKAAVQRTLHEVDPLVAPYDMMTMQQRRDYTQWPSRVFGNLFASFGSIALVLALTGIYSVMAYTVSRRRREIGVRMALGAAPLDIMRDVLRRASLLSATGIVIGVAGAAAVTQLLGGMLYEVEALDLKTFISVPILLGITAILASWIPARRASTVDPMEALRSD